MYADGRMPRWSLSPDRCFAAEPSQRKVARELYAEVKDLPLVCPHGHVDPKLFSDEDARFGSPAELFIIPDHYVFRMLYSQGVRLEDLGIPTRDGSPVETDHRKIWQRFAEHFHLFRGTPSGMWLSDEFVNVFGVQERLSAETADRIYDFLEQKLAQPEFSPRALFKQFNIEALTTTDAATSSLEHHQALKREGWNQVRPTFRPDAVLNLETPNWQENIKRLSEVSGIEVKDYPSFIRALEQRRQFFKEMGATATDHAAVTPKTERLVDADASRMFKRALVGKIKPGDAGAFTAHMLMEMARMSADDGLVMQLHIGSFRNHNDILFEKFGADMGADIPLQTEWTKNLRPLLNAYANDPDFSLVLFTLDETTYGRELAPLAGHYPSVYLGPPWWFFDSIKGNERYLDAVVETAGIKNLAGFNDDTRALASIPARHDLWRRVTCNWIAGLVVRGIVDEEDALEMAKDLAYRQAKRAYKLI